MLTEKEIKKDLKMFIHKLKLCNHILAGEITEEEAINELFNCEECNP